MRIFDPHAHMTSRTTDDYEAMYASGVRALVEPAFWLGQPRTSVGSFIDYFNSLLGWERFRAAQFGIRHHCTIGLNPKEANDDLLRRELLGQRLLLGRRHRVEADLAHRHHTVLGQEPGQDVDHLAPQEVVIGLLRVEPDRAVMADAELPGPEPLPPQQRVEVVHERPHGRPRLPEPERRLHQRAHARGVHRLVVVGRARRHVRVRVEDPHAVS